MLFFGNPLTVDNCCVTEKLCNYQLHQIFKCNLCYIMWTWWFSFIIVIFPLPLGSACCCLCAVYILHKTSLSSPPPFPPLLCGRTLPLAIHPSSPSSPAPLPANSSSPHHHMTDRGAGRWNRMSTIHRPERDGSDTAVASQHTHTHALAHRQKYIHTHTFRKQVCRSRGSKTAPFYSLDWKHLRTPEERRGEERR